MAQDAISPNQFTHLTDDAQMIQAAVDEAAKAGQSVVIPRVNARTGAPLWVLERAILLSSGSAVYLDNAHLRLADGVYCNFFKNSHGRTVQALLPQGRQHDIYIGGKGNALLDGGVHNGLTQRTANQDGRPDIIENTCIHMHNVERVTVENLRIVDHRWWAMTFHYCSHGRISNISFACDQGSINLDGVDLRTGCNRFLIENLSGHTGDDMVALTNLDWDAHYDVEGMDTGIHDVTIRNIVGHIVGNHALVRLLNHGGRLLYNILVDGVCDQSLPGGPWRSNATVRIGDLYYNFDSRMAAPGETRGIIVRNVQSRAHHVVWIACTLEDAIIDGVQLYDEGGDAVCMHMAQVRNVRLSNVQYAVGGKPRASDRGSGLPFTEDTQQALCAVYASRSTVRDFDVNGLTAAAALDCVFCAHESDVELTVTGLRKLGGAVDTVRGDTVRLTEK